VIGSDKCVLSWPTNTRGGQVQSITNVTPPLIWVPLTNDVSQSNGQFRIEVPLLYPQEYFRVSYALSNFPAPMGPQPAYISVQPLTNSVEQGHDAYLSIKA